MFKIRRSIPSIKARLIYKIRHHRGHGIHSPFVFSLITQVIEEKGLYYAYGDIAEFMSTHLQVLHEPTKYELLSFKLINYFNPKTILEIGSGSGVNTLYLTASSSKISCVSVEQDEEKRNEAQALYAKWNRNIRSSTTVQMLDLEQGLDCVFIDLVNYEIDNKTLFDKILPSVSENSMIIINGLRTKKGNRLLWNKLIESNKVTVSLDLYHLGILFFKPKLHKRNYKLSF